MSRYVIHHVMFTEKAVQEHHQMYFKTTSVTLDLDLYASSLFLRNILIISC